MHGLGLIVQEVVKPSFWSFTFSNLLEVGGFLAAIVTVALHHRRDLREIAKEREVVIKERDKAIEQQAKMHQENSTQLKTLIEFHQQQMRFNSQRDRQVRELEKQTTALAEMVKGLDRRLQLMENRRSAA